MYPHRDKVSGTQHSLREDQIPNYHRYPEHPQNLMMCSFVHFQHFLKILTYTYFTRETKRTMLVPRRYSAAQASHFKIQISPIAAKPQLNF